MRAFDVRGFYENLLSQKVILILGNQYKNCFSMFCVFVSFISHYWKTNSDDNSGINSTERPFMGKGKCPSIQMYTCPASKG